MRLHFLALHLEVLRSREEECGGRVREVQVGGGGEVQEVLVEERSTRGRLAREREELGEQGGLLDNMVLLGDYRSSKREVFFSAKRS